MKILAAGTEDDDHNPRRIASRNLFDAAIRGALQLPVHLQRDTLRDAEGDYGYHRVSLLTEQKGRHSPVRQIVASERSLS